MKSKLLKQKEWLTIRLKIKTKSLWFAAQVIQEKLEPTKTVDQVYELLKFMGKNIAMQENPALKEKLSNKEK